jgi:hypothetical protein
MHNNNNNNNNNDDNYNISMLKNKILSNVYRQDESIIFEASIEEKYILAHEQDCCEQVTIESIEGDLNDLIGHPILIAEEASGEVAGDPYSQWTFYKLATIKGHVTVRFIGNTDSSYSLDVSFNKIKPISFGQLKSAINLYSENYNQSNVMVKVDDKYRVVKHCSAGQVNGKFKIVLVLV